MKKKLLHLFLKEVKDNEKRKALDQIFMYIWSKGLEIKFLLVLHICLMWKETHWLIVMQWHHKTNTF